MALNSIQDFAESASPVGAQAAEHEGRLDSQAHSSYLLHHHPVESPSINNTRELQCRWDETSGNSCTRHPSSVEHLSSEGAPTDLLTVQRAALPGNSASTSSSNRNRTQPQHQQQQPPPLAQKRLSSDVLHPNLYDELRQQHKHAKHAILRMHQNVHAVRLQKSPRAKQGRARRASAGSAPVRHWHNTCATAAFTPVLGSSPVDYGGTLLLPASALQLQQHNHQPAPDELEPDTAPSPDLPSLTVVVRMLLQLAAAQAGPATADALKQQLLQQVHGRAAAARHVGAPFSVAAAVQQAVPGLKAAVLQACSLANGHVDTAAAAAAFTCEDDAAALVAEGWPHDDATAVEHISVPTYNVAACCSRNKNADAAIAASGIAAIETALLEAACEVQLESLCIGSLTDKVPAAADAQGSGTSSTFDLDIDQLLQSELAAAMGDDYSI